MADSSILSASRQSTRFLIGGACLEAIALLVLSGCTRLQVRLGSKVHLEAVPVKSMEARLAKGPGIVPGQKSSLVTVITDADGKVLQTEGAGHGKVLWSDLKVTASVVTANKKGVVSLPRDPRVSDGKMPHVTITVPSHPDIRAELDIPVRYDYNFTANFSGSSGTSGFNGTDGLDGTSGSIGSIDPNNPLSRRKRIGRDQWLERPGRRTRRKCSTCTNPGGPQIRKPSSSPDGRSCTTPGGGVPS